MMAGGFITGKPVFLLVLSAISSVLSAIGNRPIIGVVMEAVDNTPDTFFVMGDNQRFIEQSAGAVVPVFTKQSDEYYDNIMSRINGILVPGGSVDLIKSPYGQVDYGIYRRAMKMNDAGNYFPILGICLGIQEMSTWPLTPRSNLMSNVTGAWNLSLPLNFTKAAARSRFYGNISSELKNILSTQSVTPNYHAYALALKTYENSKELRDFYSVTSTNTDTRGLEYVSSMEAYDYPFYGIQWHAEKISYWYPPKNNLNHSYNAVLIAQYVSNFFVNEARKSKQSFKSAAELSRFLINSYQIIFNPTSLEEIYHFNMSQVPHFDK